MSTNSEGGYLYEFIHLFLTDFSPPIHACSAQKLFWWYSNKWSCQKILDGKSVGESHDILVTTGSSGLTRKQEWNLLNIMNYKLCEADQINHFMFMRFAQNILWIYGILKNNWRVWMILQNIWRRVDCDILIDILSSNSVLTMLLPERFHHDCRASLGRCLC